MRDKENQKIHLPGKAIFDIVSENELGSIQQSKKEEIHEENHNI
jgi:hypothetical protein